MPLVIRLVLTPAPLVFYIPSAHSSDPRPLSKPTQIRSLSFQSFVPSLLFPSIRLTLLELSWNRLFCTMTAPGFFASRAAKLIPGQQGSFNATNGSKPLFQTLNIQKWDYRPIGSCCKVKIHDKLGGCGGSDLLPSAHAIGSANGINWMTVSALIYLWLCTNFFFIDWNTIRHPGPSRQDVNLYGHCPIE